MKICKKGWQLLEAGGTKGGLRGHPKEDPGGSMGKGMLLRTQLEICSWKEVLHARGGTCRQAYIRGKVPPKGRWGIKTILAVTPHSNELWYFLQCSVLGPSS